MNVNDIFAGFGWPVKHGETLPGDQTLSGDLIGDGINSREDKEMVNELLGMPVHSIGRTCEIWANVRGAEGEQLRWFPKPLPLWRLSCHVRGPVRPGTPSPREDGG